MAEKKKNPAEPKLDKLRLFDRPIKMLAKYKLNTALSKTDPLIRRLKDA